MLDAAEDSIPQLWSFQPPPVGQQAGVEPAKGTPSRFPSRALENLTLLVVLFFSAWRFWVLQSLFMLKASTEHSEEVSECFGGEEEGMIESNVGIKENINKESHNMTLKNLLEFSSAEMV